MALVNDFVKFNNHREEIFTPSTTTFVDESISYCYGIGVEWIRSGLSMYVEIYCNPKSGLEIQCASSSKSVIKPHLRLIITS